MISGTGEQPKGPYGFFAAAINCLTSQSFFGLEKFSSLPAFSFYYSLGKR